MRLFPERSPRFEAFVAPAQARPQVWRLVVGTVIAAAVWLAGTAAVTLVAYNGASRREQLVLYLASFVGLILGLALAAGLLQRRSLRSLVGPDGFRPRDFGLGIAAITILSLVGLLPILWLAPPVRQTGVAAWASWLPLALPALLAQTTAEELAFRGWLMQGLAARFRSRWIWWMVPSGLFGLLHWDPAGLGGDAWIAVISATVMGLVLADVTARTGNLSAAIGLHFANNVVALLLVAMPTPLAELSLFVMTPGHALDTPMRSLLVIDLATTLLAYAVWLAACARRRRLHSRRAGSI